MASILLSFVGSQDPYSEKTEMIGSIVNLVTHLRQQSESIKRVILLYTEATAQNAIDTRHWLVSEQGLALDQITLLPVSEALSLDPINQQLAVQEVRQAIAQAQQEQTEQDVLEFNASSGTPAMKASWSILQASGYVQRSHLWQVRNPDQTRPGQLPIFRDDVNVLKSEFDLQVIRQQIQDYNYSGALVSLEQSNLATVETQALLNYGYYRLSMNFDRAFAAIAPIATLDPCWVQEIAPLRQKDRRSLLQEAYFNTLIRLQTRQYADFLVGVFRLQEQSLSYLVQDRLGLQVSGKPGQQQQSWQVIKQADQGKLYQFLQNYTLPRGDKLNLDRGINRYGLQAIVEYYPQCAAISPLIRELNQYCELRNESVHGFVGVSEIEDKAALLNTLRKLMKQMIKVPEQNPFDRLNEQLFDFMNPAL